MNVTFRRDLLAQTVIVLALCIGGWMLFVQPTVEELQEVEAIIAYSRAGAAGLNQEAIEDMADRMSGLRRYVLDVRRRGRLADDSSRLYGLIMDLAQEHGVTVQSLEPGSGREMSVDGRVGRTRIEITLEGEYQQVASFLSALQNVEGFIRPTSLSLTPREKEAERQLVVARYSCEALSFTLSEALSNLAGKVDADG
ncbi:MAG: hypothetical protein JSV91_12750 [Phycisphaerales bacterium]|nr:MAG: hypothetical protein JSV91_12750 [Phycisphaerales bacterium]